MTDIVERLRFLASGQDDAHSVAIDEAADEITRLRAQVAALEADIAAEKLFSKQAMQAAQDIAAQRDALEVDAGRYRWLREELTIERSTYHEGKHVAWWPCIGVQSGLDEHIDAAIDAARGKA